MITLRHLPKVSLNQWYAGSHWTKRTKLKSQYKSIIKAQFKDRFSKEYKYNVDYTFYFKRNPLDSSNCVAMAKMIEDIIFEDDKFDIVLSNTYRSVKDKDERVEIMVTEVF